MQLRQFAFDLPPELIAQFPPEERGRSRLLQVSAQPGARRDLAFHDLPDLLSNGDVLVMNDTRVIKARLFGEKATGGKIELLVERIIDAQRVLAQVRASHPPLAHSTLRFTGGVEATVIGRQDGFFLIEFAGSIAAADVLDRIGKLPLPPYIERPASEADESRYQTVYAREPGAVAAPTAGLHFDRPMLDRLQARGVELAYLTLHVGAGTFQPVRVDDLDEHRMHSERYTLPIATVTAIERTRARGGRVVAVGTTTLRALESASGSGTLVAGSAETDLFIRPGYEFKVVDRLITNFHLPCSTLLILVCAFAGMDIALQAYRHAVATGYRFFSYGDAMLLDRSVAPVPVLV
ncbi:MAG: tRNA preQ1(34) S-adenosylmethionine ribosyltransferase-isomerase QueA [Betaproteobacteria bacterium]